MPLSAEQLLPVTAVTTSGATGDILVIAGPGSGKTSTLIAAILAAVGTHAGAIARASRIAAISYTNNSAAELKVRLANAAKAQKLPALSRVHVSTFHAWVARLTARQVEPLTYAPINLGPVGLALALQLKHPQGGGSVFGKTAVAAAERHLEGCETFAEMRRRNFNHVTSQHESDDARLFADLENATADLQAVLALNQLQTFGTLMASGTKLAAALPALSLDWLFIDEAQDLNRTQKQFVEALQKQTGCRVFAIADDDQGIYKFRGASSAFLQDLEARAASTPPTAQRFLLTENFRSTQPIVDLCREWITPNWTELGRQPKKLHTSRAGLPIVILAASGKTGNEDRGRHAGIILQATLRQKLIDCGGETALLAFSPASENWELDKSGLASHDCTDAFLPASVLEAFLELCRKWPAPPPAWHHPLWQQFIQTLSITHPAGVDGLDDLYACVEVLRRLAPALAAPKAADLIDHLCGGKHPPFRFGGDRPTPDYAADAINRLSLHSSKGMEFRAVWLNGNGYTYAVKPSDTTQGQPNLFGELFDWAASQVTGQAQSPKNPTAQEIQNANQRAASLENRRLLYVGMSRATDLLLISTPYTEREFEHDDYIQQENAFYKDLEAAAISGKVPYAVINTDADAHAFAGTIAPRHRHPTWKPPVRHQVESFTSLTQNTPNAPRPPGPQSSSAITGDHFHRIMHLLCLEPALLADRLANANNVTDIALVARVSTTAQPLVVILLTRFFADTTNQPWKWLQNGARTEVQFEQLIPLPANPPAECLIKGFIDVAIDNSNGDLRCLVDWKTGTPTNPPDPRHAQQLQFYAHLLTPTAQTTQPQLINYYPATQQVATHLTLTPQQIATLLAPVATPPPSSPTAAKPATPATAPVAQPAPKPGPVTAPARPTSKFPHAAITTQSPGPQTPSALLNACLAVCKITKLGCKSAEITYLAKQLSKNYSPAYTAPQLQQAFATLKLTTFTHINQAPTGQPFLTQGKNGLWLNIK